MRIALVHDYLNQYGGAERVLESFCELFPEAPIYTLFYDEEKTRGKFKGKKIITSFLNNKFVINNHRLFIPLMPLAAFFMKVDSDYDMVLSSSAGFGKGIRSGKKTVHVSYCHTPLRYAWEYYRYFNWPNYLKILSAPAFWYLRKWDKWVGKKPQKIIANSKYIAEKIKSYYGRGAEVIYPPVDTEKFCIHPRTYKHLQILNSILSDNTSSYVLKNYVQKLDEGVNPKVIKGDYFLAVGRLIHYKKFDLIIQAFNKLNLPLLIVGNGPELENLKKLVRSPKIEFLTSVTDDQLIVLYNGAQAFIFPQVEDFGLVAAEAQACGLPVISFNQGGGKEIVSEGVTGILFNNQNVDDLIMAIKRFQIRQFDRKLIRESALRFSKNKFKKAILKAIYNARDGK